MEVSVGRRDPDGCRAGSNLSDGGRESRAGRDGGHSGVRTHPSDGLIRGVAGNDDGGQRLGAASHGQGVVGRKIDVRYRDCGRPNIHVAGLGQVAAIRRCDGDCGISRGRGGSCH